MVLACGLVQGSCNVLSRQNETPLHVLRLLEAEFFIESDGIIIESVDYHGAKSGYLRGGYHTHERVFEECFAKALTVMIGINRKSG
ncbi:putative predicted protein [Rhizobium favelukesii]|uniref:Uncharacterized protein n=1 Tax=Rhizobium favelukesii TaxID=348824 RepID=W6R600_9HYPH|nr:putative predicted protein [Rhizobium favelukesii]